MAEAYALNDPLIVVSRSGARSSAQEKKLSSFVAVDKLHVVIETIKLAEDGRGVIIRLYESQRKRGVFTLKSAFPLVSAWRTNLLEEDQEIVETVGQEVRVEIKPY